MYIAARHLRQHSDGFTLIEILIVVVILGIIATIAIPQFSNATHDTREAMLKDELRYLRSQIQVFRAQHKDVSPGYPGGNSLVNASESQFVAQMTSFTADTCDPSNTPDLTHRYGPYLSSMPKNPLNNSATIVVMPNGVPLRAPANDGFGWIYRPDTQEIIANLTDSDASGMPYSRY